MFYNSDGKWEMEFSYFFLLWRSERASRAQYRHVVWRREKKYVDTRLSLPEKATIIATYFPVI